DPFHHGQLGESDGRPVRRRGGPPRSREGPRGDGGRFEPDPFRPTPQGQRDRSVTASNQGVRAVSERVVYSGQTFAKQLAKQPHAVLATLPGGTWVSVADDVLLDLLDQGLSLPLLYFSRADYANAVRDLPASEVTNAVQRRLLRWSPQALNRSLDWLYRGE